MSAKRTDLHRIQDLVRLHREGQAMRRIARELRMGRNTARHYRDALRAGGVLDGDPAETPPLNALAAAIAAHLPGRAAPQQVSTVERWRRDIERLLDAQFGPQAIHDRLRAAYPDFRASLAAVKRLVARIRSERGSTPPEPVSQCPPSEARPTRSATPASAPDSGRCFGAS